MSDILLLSKEDPFSQSAGEIARVVFGERLVWQPGNVGEPFPVDQGGGTLRVILSFLSPWIVPQALLDRADLALNWHPGSTDYPGIGCYNFALYDGARTFGATCHHMAAKVDTGRIVEEQRFPLFEADTVATLKLRTMVTMTAMFHDHVCRLAGGWQAEPCGATWSRRPFTRRELEQLKKIDPAMDAAEVRRRIRATTFPGYPGPFVEIAGERFEFPVPP